jgi:hypothetical protein
MFISRCLLLVLMLLAPTCALAKGQPAVILTASLDQASYMVGKPVILTLDMTNGRLAPIDFFRGGGEFRFTVSNAQGHSVEATAYGLSKLSIGGYAMAPHADRMRNTCQVGLTLANGHTWVFHYNLSRLFNLTQPGLYSIKVTRTVMFEVMPDQYNQVPNAYLSAPLDYHRPELPQPVHVTVTFKVRIAANPNTNSRLITAFELPSALVWWQVAGGVQIAVELPQQSVPDDQPVVATVWLRNTTPHTISLGPMDKDLASFQLTAPTRTTNVASTAKADSVMPVRPFSDHHDIPIPLSICLK